MLIPKVTKLEPENAGAICECCLVETAEITLEHEEIFDLCVECGFQVARAFLEDLYLMFPEYWSEGENPSDKWSPSQRTENTMSVIAKATRELLRASAKSDPISTAKHQPKKPNRKQWGVR